MYYTINYGTGSYSQADTLEEAKQKADEGASQTNEPITIEDKTGDEVARRPWHGYLDGLEDMINPIRFGASGYYGDWQIKPITINH